LQTTHNRHTATLSAEILVVAYMGVIGLAAHLTGIYLFLFPELAALSHDVLTRPRGKWASQPLRLILTPTLTAAVGLFITRHTSYGAIASAVIALLALVVIKLLRSAIGPAISAGVLPMVLGETSWLYPVSICAGLVGLVVLLWAFRRWGPSFEAASDFTSGGAARHSAAVEALEAIPHDRFWVLSLLAFVLVLGAAAQMTGLRFILFPPLIVMAYEIFGHPEVPGWMARPIFFPFVCFLTASIGLFAVHLIHASFVAVMVTTLFSIAVLRAFRVHMPPALAVGLLPFVMTAPNIWYPVSVGLGTIALMLSFWARRYFQNSFDSAAAEEV
jgi:nitrogen fixation-related uncharacterized protein